MTHQKVRPDFPTAGETDSARARAAANQTVKACGETPKHCARQQQSCPHCGVCVSPKPNARAQVYCSTRSRMRGRINPPPIHRSSEPSSSPRRSLKKKTGGRCWPSRRSTLRHLPGSGASNALSR